MVGVFLFCLYFSIISLLIGFGSRQTTTPWWVKIVTEAPHCTYYFGPFNSSIEAQLTQTGYIEDLVQEGARVCSVVIAQDRPQTLTLCEEEGYYS